MDKQYEEEINYLKDKYLNIKYDNNRFKLYLEGGEKFICGIISGDGEKAPFSNISRYKTIYDTLKDIDWKVKLSFENALKYSYSKEVQEDFNIIGPGSKEEKLSYYYTENALFRTSTLWDILAQLFCEFYNIQIEKEKIYYNRLFNIKNKKYYHDHKINQIEKINDFKEHAMIINNYLNEADNTNLKGEWRGNHKYTNECRNKMTHRNSPNITALSDYDLAFKDHPSFMLKRIIEDYYVVSKFISEILDEIENKELKI